MNYTVFIRPEAEQDIREAFYWYEDKRTGLGHDFLLQFEAGINIITRNPDIHPIEYRGARKHVIKRFPYKIIYLIDKQKIIILAVLHGKRNPYLTTKRTDNINKVRS